MIGLAVALRAEAQGVIDKLKDKKELTVANKEVFTGKLEGKDVALILTNIGKVNAAVSAQILIDKFHVDKIINFGSAGGIMGKANVLGYYQIAKCCQYDFDCSLIDDVSVGFIQGFNDVYFHLNKEVFDFLPAANIASSDHFTAEEKDIATVSKLDCTLFDMEIGGIGQTCTLNNIPLYAFKGVTDVHGSGADGDTFYKNLKTVCDGFYDILKKGLSKC